MRHVSPKRWYIFSDTQSFIFQRIGVFITTAVRTSNHTMLLINLNVTRLRSVLARNILSIILQSCSTLNNFCNIIIFYIIVSGVRLNSLGSSATTGLLYQPQMRDGDCGAIGGLNIGSSDRSTRRKPASAPLCPPQISHTRPGLEHGPTRWEASD
jgi:hypothetical protein